MSTLPLNLCHTLARCCFWLYLFGSTSFATAAEAPRILTRVFFQDDHEGVVKWADVAWGEPPKIGTAAVVPGFPKLNSERQTLVQMRSARGLLLVGVRDDSNGTFQSGWVLIDSGVKRDEHGDHSHWSYPQPPRVRATVLDEKQGNPAHVYCYDDIFYVANDRLNGYTRLDPAAVAEKDTAEQIRRRAGFHQGGGNHITLAVNGHYGFAAWIDREGANKNRVDITALDPRGNKQIDSSFELPSGGIHGAIACQGKIFFAPSDGICWVSASHAPKIKPSAIRHLSLGKKDDAPRRTGAFVSLGRYVGFVAGAGDDTTLGLIDASQTNPSVMQLPLAMVDGNRPVGLTMAISRGGQALAFLFHDHAQEVDAPNQLSIIELDPNGDKSYSDAKVANVIEIGRALVEGHSGHHSLDLDAERRRGFIAYPGDGNIAILSLADRKIEHEFKVGGAPSSVVCIGGRQESD